MNLMHLLASFRPRQWLKNLVVFAPVVFANLFLVPDAILRSLAAFVALCLLASSLYLLNDIRDRNEDKVHPTKRLRPIASGRVSVRFAAIFALLLAGTGLYIALTLGITTAVMAMGFMAVNVGYTWFGKSVAILDVMFIGASFVARVLVGAAAISVPASSWLLLTLFFLATYLGFTKRSAELRASNTSLRRSLEGYSHEFLVHARSATLAATLSLYTLYTFDSPFGDAMALTVPFVFFGLLRYQAIADADKGDNDGPSHHVYQDRQLQAAIILWGISVLIAIGFA